MVTFNQDSRFQSVGSKRVSPANRLAERVRHYFDQHPDVAREEFLLDAVRKEILFRERKEMRNRGGIVGRERERSNRRSTDRPPLSVEDIRIHALLAERVAVLHYERHGLWPKFRRFLFGNRAVRLPELQPQRTGRG